jgi:TonB family protein
MTKEAATFSKLVGLIAIVGLCALAATTSRASSAVAVAINKNGGLGYGYSHESNVTEAEIKQRATQECLNWGGRDVKIIASTAKQGYGAVVQFQTTDNKANYAASLAATTQQQATNDAMRKANAAGGHSADVVATWRDGSAMTGARAIAIYAPKPDYPAEARARHLTGSGVVMLDVDVATGEVMSAHMLQSMGHKILDDAALDAFRKWRFKPGKAAPHIKIPIRYSMNGTT